jgi:hypothetical protein
MVYNVKGVSASGGIHLFVAGLKLYGSEEFQKLIVVIPPPLHETDVVCRLFL